MDNSFEIKKKYYLLKGHCKAITETDIHVSQKSVDDINRILSELEDLTGEDFSFYYISKDDAWDVGEYRNSTILLRMIPVIMLLENMYISSSEYQIAKIGYLYRSIEDKELQDRCSDILLGDKAFDRAINQATQVLENRIKIKAKLSNTGLTSMPLVSKAIHSKLEQTILKFSDDEKVQEAYSYLFKGIIGEYRNPSHHTLDSSCSREHALKVCAYIDELLKELNNTEYIEK